MNDAKFAKIVNFAKIKIEKNAFSECLHTISDARIEKNENFDDENEKITDWNDETIELENEITCSTDCWTNFDFDDMFFESSRTIFDTKIEKVDNFDENDMFVKSNVNIEIVNLIEW